MLTEVKGLVLRTTDINESDRMVTLYTAEMGIVSALAKGSRSLKSRKMSSTQQFCYSTLVLFGQGDKYWIREASLIENFFGLRESIEKLALGAYIVDVISAVGTAEGDADMMRLTLNSLYAIATDKCAVDKIKAAFEIRLAAILGFMPDVITCHTCGKGDGEFFFDIMAGAIECSECHRKAERLHTTLTDEHESHILAILSPGAKVALGYCIYSPLEKLFSFSIGHDDMDLFVRAAELYLLNHLERGFKTLEFYNEVKR